MHHKPEHIVKPSRRPSDLRAGLLLGCAAVAAHAQSTQLELEYLMTYTAPLDPGVAVDASMRTFNVRPGSGEVKGPQISGRFISPGADWLRVMPSGALRLDARVLIRTDDNAAIYISYNGIAQHSKESLERLGKGETLTDKDVPSFVVAPAFQTSADTYAWLNRVQAVGKMVEPKLGDDGYIKYDVFVVR